MFTWLQWFKWWVTLSTRYVEIVVHWVTQLVSLRPIQWIVI